MTMTTQVRRARPLYRDLSVQVLVAMLVGALVGYLWPQSADSWRPLGDLFIRLVRMIVAPIIFCTVDVIGIPNEVPVLVGQIPLEMMDLVVDLQGRRLIGNPAHGGERSSKHSGNAMQGVALTAEVHIALQLKWIAHPPMGVANTGSNLQSRAPPMRQ